MNRVFVSRRMLLAGTSAIAILAGARAAQAESWDSPGMYTFVPTFSGDYEFGVIGAVGGRATNAGQHPQGGVGAVISGEIMLTRGELVYVVVGGPGENGPYAGGGGGLSAISASASGGPFIVAGGGGGAGLNYSGLPAQDAPNGGAGGGTFGGAGGVAGTGGGGGTEDFAGGAFSSGGGGFGLLGPGGNGAGNNAGQGGVGFAGGTGAANGGFGGGGGASVYSGGGGGGFSGGGGGSPFLVGSYGFGVVFSGGGGGGSIASGLLIGAASTSGTLNGAGYVLIDKLSVSVPEPSTWAMMLSGFSALGAMLIRRKRGAKPA